MTKQQQTTFLLSIQLFQTQHGAVKTIKNSDWGAFLHRFCHPELPTGKKAAKYPSAHYDIPPGDSIDHPFNSFVTDIRSDMRRTEGDQTRPHPLSEMTVAEVSEAAVRWKEGRPSWTALRRVFDK